MTIYVKCDKEPVKVLTDPKTIMDVLISRDRLTIEEAIAKIKEKYVNFNINNSIDELFI